MLTFACLDGLDELVEEGGVALEVLEGLREGGRKEGKEKRKRFKAWDDRVQREGQKEGGRKAGREGRKGGSTLLLATGISPNTKSSLAGGAPPWPRRQVLTSTKPD